MDLWCVCWRDGSIPDDPVVLARLTSVPLGQFRRLWPKVRAMFSEKKQSSGIAMALPQPLLSPRLERQRRELDGRHQRRVSAGKLGAQALHKQAVKGNGKAKHSSSIARALPQPSSSSSSSSATPNSNSLSLAVAARGPYEALVAHLQLVNAESTRELGWEQRRLLAAEVWFAYWQAIRNHKRALYSTDREKLIVRCLKQNGDNLSELLFVVDGAHRDPWANGSDPKARSANDDPGLLLRDRAHIERFANLCPEFKRGQLHPMAEKYAVLIGVPHG